MSIATNNIYELLRMALDNEDMKSLALKETLRLPDYASNLFFEKYKHLLSTENLKFFFNKDRRNVGNQYKAWLDYNYIYQLGNRYEIRSKLTDINILLDNTLLKNEIGELSNNWINSDLIYQIRNETTHTNSIPTNFNKIYKNTNESVIRVLDVDLKYIKNTIGNSKAKLSVFSNTQTFKNNSYYILAEIRMKKLFGENYLLSNKVFNFYKYCWGSQAVFEKIILDIDVQNFCKDICRMYDDFLNDFDLIESNSVSL